MAGTGKAGNAEVLSILDQFRRFFGGKNRKR
jgi:hypothetical protein